MKKAAQETKTDSVVHPVIIPDLDKVRHMPIDRKDVVDALAMDYEDELAIKKQELEAKVSAGITELSTYFIHGTESDRKQGSKEVQDYFKAVDKALKSYMKPETKYDINVYRQGKHRSNSVNFCSVSIDNLNNLYTEGFLQDPSKRLNCSYYSYDDKLITLHIHPTSKWYDKSKDYLKVTLHDSVMLSDTENMFSLVSKGKITVTSSETVLYIPVPKEAEQISAVRAGIAQQIVANYLALKDIEKQLENLPNVVRRMKARLTKKAISETSGGHQVLEYFTSELTESKRITGELPMLTKNAGKKRR